MRTMPWCWAMRTGESMDYFYKGLFAVGYDGYTVQDLLPIVMELGAVNLDCMAMLDRANRQPSASPPRHR